MQIPGDVTGPTTHVTDLASSNRLGKLDQQFSVEGFVIKLVRKVFCIFICNPVVASRMDE